MRIDCYSVPKIEGFNEDCYKIIKTDPLRVVLCDGASESYDSKSWARILTENEETEEILSPDWLLKKIQDYETNIDQSKLSWSKRKAYEKGSFSTFLYVEFIDDGICEIKSVGDSTAFLIDLNQIKQSFPYNNPSQFKRKPYLLSTRPELNSFLKASNTGFAHTKFNIVDTNYIILLMTDALACWLLENKNNPFKIEELLNISTQNDFAKFITIERLEKRLKLDDTTMIRIAPSKPGRCDLPINTKRRKIFHSGKRLKKVPKARQIYIKSGSFLPIKIGEAAN